MSKMIFEFIQFTKDLMQKIRYIKHMEEYIIYKYEWNHELDLFYRFVGQPYRECLDRIEIINNKFIQIEKKLFDN